MNNKSGSELQFREGRLQVRELLRNIEKHFKQYGEKFDHNDCERCQIYVCQFLDLHDALPKSSWSQKEFIADIQHRRNDLLAQLSHLQKLCEEQRVEIADRADTERSMAQAMLEDGEKIKELESQLAEKEKEIERLNRLLELTKNKWIEDTVKEGGVVLLQSQLATQTERVRVMREALELASKANDIDEESGIYIVPRHEIADRAKQALKQDSLGDSK